MEKLPLLGDAHKIQVNSDREVRWSGVSLSVPDRRTKSTKLILESCAGVVSAGEVTAIIGPSGAGKTSLLNVLAGRTTKGLLTGSRVLLNGRPIHEADASGEIAYVTQDDTIYAHTSVREALMFSAQLRLPEAIPVAEKACRVEALIKRLGLEKCADTKVGSELKRGISGGEKKRTSIGIELITEPGILFLDEPTSGLDSFAAMQTIKLLQQLSRQGCVVVSTIHQPSSEVFVLFDKTFLMAEGHVMYGGPTDKIPTHFESLGHPCPPNFNVADHVLFLMQTLSPEALGTARKAWDVTAKPAIKDSLRTALGPRQERKRATGCCTQTRLLFGREMMGTWRNKPALYARFGMTTVLNLLFALIFKSAAQWVDDDGHPKDLQSHFGALTQVVIGLMFGASQPMMLEFPLERPIFIREYATSHYGVVPYFISKTLVELPITFIQCSLVFCVTYWIMDFNGSIVFMILTGWGLSLVAASMSLMLGCALPDVRAAMQLSPVVFVPQLLFAGFFIKITQIPVFLRWVQYLCSLKFAMNLFMLNEFYEPCKVKNLLKDTNIGNVTANDINEMCRLLLSQNQAHPEDWYFYVGVLAAIFVVFRGLAMCLLKAKAKGGD